VSRLNVIFSDSDGSQEKVVTQCAPAMEKQKNVNKKEKRLEFFLSFEK
jgi:hypothetical protein